MQFTISTRPDGQTFPANDDQDILDAALTAGLLLPYGCRDGACGACKARIIEGRVDHGDESRSPLTQDERDAGYTLLCQSQARSDVTLEVKVLKRDGDIEIKQLPCRVQEFQRVAPDVMIVKIKLPETESFRFRAGQYIDFLLPDNRRRSFSIANAPHVSDHLELHIRRIKDGYFTRQVFEQMKPRDMLRFEGPLGTFFFREDSDKPVILLAGGTGFAPIKSIMEHVIHTGLQRTITLYWGAYSRDGLYMDALVNEWARTLPDFNYIPVLSGVSESNSWSGRKGLVHQSVMADHSDLSGHEVYACGSPAMIEAARKDFTTCCGLPEEAFFADAFTFST